MDFEQEFYNYFKDKYSFLVLRSVVVSENDGECVFTFFYPSSCQNLQESEKKEIIDYIKNTLNLSGLSLKVKFMKVYVEEKLIRKNIEELIKDKHKLLSAYISQDDISIDISNIDVQIQINVTEHMFNHTVENKIASSISEDLKNNFLTNFIVNFNPVKDKVEEVDIESVPLVVRAKKTPRYNVEIIKDIIGKDNTPKPEYLSNIKQPKSAVIVAGFISNITRKEFTIKKGKRIGEKKAYYTFNLTDESGKIECIYFSSNANQKRMDALEEAMYLLLHGDVKVGLNRKLTLYVDKMALAMRLNDDENNDEGGAKIEMREWDIVEKLTSTEQKNMFNIGRYNDKISKNTIVVFDLETTGLSFEDDEIIEIGAVKIVNGDIVEKFTTFVKPENPIPESASEINHITDDMVADAPPIEYAIKKFYEFCEGAILCGHNVLGFDIKFVIKFGEMFGLNFDNDVIDTMNEVRNSNLKLTRINLGAVTKALGIELVGAHRAWNDALATAKVLLKLNEI